MTVRIVNPLPRALAHYDLAVRELLPRAEHRIVAAERADGPLPRRVLRQLAARRVDGGVDDVLVLWPAFGRLDPLSWVPAVRSGHRVHLVVHDPRPLRDQRGDGALGRRTEAIARRAGVRLVAHSEPARAALAADGWGSCVLPHPLRLPNPRPTRVPDGDVLVLGQHKPTRARDPLVELASVRTLDGRRAIRGRGWPRMEGWAVDERFLTETEFDLALRSAACLVLPYDRYFQSGVAVRALESGVPVVADRHPFLEELLGADWPCFARRGGWAEAVDLAGRIAPADLAARAHDAYARAHDSWRSAFPAAAK